MRVLSTSNVIFMKNLVLILILFAIPSVFAYSPGDCIGVEPNATGDWLINVSTNCSDTIIELNGDLIINNSFNLNFSNVTLVMNSSDLSGLWIYNNGSFYVNNSNITDVVHDMDSNYGWMNYEDSLLILENSDVSYVGRGGGENAAIEVNGNNSVIRGNNISYVNVAVYLTSFGSVIEDNNISTNYSASGSRGIYLNGCSANVSGNFIWAPYGIYAYDDTGSNITDNVIFAAYGITLTNANNTFLRNITTRDLIGYYGMYAISLSDSENVVVEDFNISRYHFGVKLDSSEGVTIRDFWIDRSDSGIHLADSANNSFFNVTLSNSSGEDLTIDFSSEVYCSNYFYGVENSDGKEVGFYNESVVLSDEEFSQLTLCNADGSNLSNITINSSEDLKTNNLNLLFSDNCALDNISSVYNMHGLVLKYSDGNVVRDSVFDLNEYDGILNYYSDGNVFLNVSADLNDFGISILRSENITINDSTLRENYDGLNGKYDLNIDYFNFSSNDPDHLCSHDINRVNGTNYQLGYFNSQVSVSDEIFSELIVCGSDGSSFSNITLYSSGGNRNNIFYLSDLTNFVMSDFSVDIFYGGMILHNVNDSNFSDGYVNNSYRNVFAYESHGNVFDNVSSYDSRLSGYVLDESFDNIVKNSWITGNLQMGFLLYNNSADNLIFNNYVRNSINVFVSSSAGGNFWNTSLTLGTNIIGGEYTGGNFWTKVSGGSFSDTCIDSSDGICDDSYSISSGNVDYLALVASSEITGCGYSINSSGNYYLAGNLSLGGSDSACINVSSDDVEIDCRGFFINGYSNLGYGVIAENVNSLSLQNCSFNSLGLTSVSLYNVEMSSFGYLFSLHSNYSGFMIVNSSLNSFRNNNASNSYHDGFTIINSSLNSFMFNEVFNNSFSGFYLEGSDSNNIYSNSILLNGLYNGSGIEVLSSQNNSVYKNIFNNSNNINVSLAVYSNNSWNRSYGNYWGNSSGGAFSDSCVDGDSDGVCDSVYNFSIGSVFAVDYLPISDVEVPSRTLDITINYSYWEDETTNFSELDDIDLADLGNVKFHHSRGKILFGVNINILRNVVLDDNIVISSNRIYINSTALPEFNKASQLTLYNISYNVPRILRDGVVCSSCDFVSYSNDELVFNVSGFSEYTSDEGSCLDGVQNFGEGGIDCGGDCSACAVIDDGDGSSGSDDSDSSSSSGATSSRVVDSDDEVEDSSDDEVCVRDIVCGNWGECVDGAQKRTCEDLNFCVGDVVEERDCEGMESFWFLVWVSFFGLVWFVVAVWLFLKVRLKFRRKHELRGVISPYVRHRYLWFFGA
jgi:hypothetical protein